MFFKHAILFAKSIFQFQYNFKIHIYVKVALYITREKNLASYNKKKFKQVYNRKNVNVEHIIKSIW